MNQNTSAKVSVAMTAYNQEAFISDAIEGVLAQKTNFPFELIIGDDCSNDTTGEICSEFAERFPQIIKYRRRDPNLGMMPNFLKTLSECRGDYIAICEGDDYWIDPNKLQRQFDLLENDQSLSVSGHNHFQQTNSERTKGYPNLVEPFILLDTDAYILDPHFQTASYFFRRSALPHQFPAWYNNVLAGDHFLILLLSLKGKIGFINKRMSVFRTYESSVTGTQGPLRIKENFVEHLRIFDRETSGRFSSSIATVILRWELAYKVYEPIGYFGKLGYFIKNFGTYFSSFERVGGIKLLAKYLFGVHAFNHVKRRIN